MNGKTSQIVPYFTWMSLCFMTDYKAMRAGQYEVLVKILGVIAAWYPTE